MITARPSTKKINLLPQEEFSSSTIGRVLTWALSTFRIIVILTEVIVMMAFLSRFWLDAKANDLNDTIRQKQAIITASADFENKFRDIQKRVQAYEAITSATSTNSKYLDTVASFVPVDINLTSFQFAEDSIQVRGGSGSEIGIAQLMANLQSNPDFTNVTLTSIGSDMQNSSLLTFGLKIDLTKGGNK